MSSSISTSWESSDYQLYWYCLPFGILQKKRLVTRPRSWTIVIILTFFRNILVKIQKLYRYDVADDDK